jgi:hypothetical protein
MVLSSIPFVLLRKVLLYANSRLQEHTIFCVLSVLYDSRFYTKRWCRQNEKYDNRFFCFVFAFLPQLYSARVRQDEIKKNVFSTHVFTVQIFVNDIRKIHSHVKVDVVLTKLSHTILCCIIELSFSIKNTPYHNASYIQ